MRMLLFNFQSFSWFFLSIFIYLFIYLFILACPHGVMFKVMDCWIVLSEFEPQLRSLSEKYP